MDESRKQFEEWCDVHPDKPNKTREGDGYRYFLADSYWEAWQAARSLTERSEWQPISKAPRDGTAFLACLEASDIPHAMRFKEGGALYLTWDGHLVADHDWPTHWMPLPRLRLHPLLQGSPGGEG